MKGRALVREFSFGALRFTHADSFPLDEMYSNVEDHKITLRLSGEFASDSPWRGTSMVVFFLYRLPAGAEPFSEEVRDYRKDEKKLVKLPEKQRFDDTVFALTDVTGDWEHDCFANSSRGIRRPIFLARI